jgi:hypothetical protein
VPLASLLAMLALVSLKPCLGDVTMRKTWRGTATADGGGATGECIFRLVVSRFNGLQRRCGYYPQRDPQTC